MKFVDLPKEAFLPKLEEEIKNGISSFAKGFNEDIEVEKVEWTANGLRVWTRNTN